MAMMIEGARLPVWSWATDAEGSVLAQARNLANLEVARHHVALMPDAHTGFGMPIGGVLLTEGAVVPYAIGVDIGCGVQIARTNLVWQDDFARRSSATSCARSSAMSRRASARTRRR